MSAISRPDFSGNGGRVANPDQNNREIFARLTPTHDIQRMAAQRPSNAPGYYGLPILKRPFWKWEIALYFFSEGISGGSYILCTLAEFTGNKKFCDAIHSGRFLSFATMLPCPPLLVADLGRPERFHHMLRITKRTSPMNHGAWALTGFGVFASALALLEVPPDAALALGLRDLGPRLSSLLRAMQRWVPNRVLAALGLPFALTMVSYPGVLLETTSNPVWSRSNFLGPLIAASSMSSGASALTLLNYGSDNDALHRALAQVENASAAAEAAALGMYLVTAGPATRPLLRGKQSKLFLFGAIVTGLVAPALLRRSSSKVLRSGVAPALALGGALALKWSVTYAGQESALDHELADKNSPTKTGEPFWGTGLPNSVPATVAEPAAVS